MTNNSNVVKTLIDENRGLKKTLKLERGKLEQLTELIYDILDVDNSYTLKGLIERKRALNREINALEGQSELNEEKIKTLEMDDISTKLSGLICAVEQIEDHLILNSNYDYNARKDNDSREKLPVSISVDCHEVTTDELNEHRWRWRMNNDDDIPLYWNKDWIEREK